MPGLRITHVQLLELQADEDSIVWFKPTGAYDYADIHGVIFRPVPDVAYPLDWPDWELASSGPWALQQRMYALASELVGTWVPDQEVDPRPTDAARRTPSLHS